MTVAFRSGETESVKTRFREHVTESVAEEYTTELGVNEVVLAYNAGPCLYLRAVTMIAQTGRAPR
jgi:hypothetical protein